MVAREELQLPVDDTNVTFNAPLMKNFTVWLFKWQIAFLTYARSVSRSGTTVCLVHVLLSARTTGQIAVSRPIVWNNGSDPMQNTSHQAYFKTTAEQYAQILTSFTTWPSTFCISLSLNAVTGMRVTNRTGKSPYKKWNSDINKLVNTENSVFFCLSHTTYVHRISVPIF